MKGRLNDNTGGNGKKEANKSIILSSISLLAAKIYSFFKTGLFGFIFTSYSPKIEGWFSNVFSRDGMIGKPFNCFRRTVAKHIENSFFLTYVKKLFEFLLCCRMKFYGTFVISFFFYSGIASLFKCILTGKKTELIAAGLSFLFIISSIPLIASKKNLALSLVDSKIGSFIISLYGKSPNSYQCSHMVGKTSTAFILGIIFGVSSYFIPAYYIIAIICAVVGIYLIMSMPEVGIIIIFFLMPFVPTMGLAALVMLTAFSLMCKFLCYRRTLKFELLDFFALMCVLMLAAGGIFSVSKQSIPPAIIFICFLGAYFLTVFLIKTHELLKKCIISLVSSAALTSIYGILMYLLADKSSASKWVDSEMFDYIGDRAVSTLENPNMLGEYLIMIIPTAFVCFLCYSKDFRSKIASLACVMIMCCCLVLTWSRGAWLAFLVGLFVFLLIWSKKSIYLIFAGIASIPFLPIILPDSIMNRLLSIGNISDSSSFYRLNIWFGTVKMLPERILSGIGIGEGAWKCVYPNYSLSGIEEAPHSHNLFLQLWVELGLAGLVIFILFFIMFIVSNFTFYKNISDSQLDPSRYNSKISEKQIKSELTLSAAAPMVGFISVLFMGMTDYAWYNYRVYLMFWLIIGLSSATVRIGRKAIERCDSSEKNNILESEKAQIDFIIKEE